MNITIDVSLPPIITNLELMGQKVLIFLFHVHKIECEPKHKFYSTTKSLGKKSVLLMRVMSAT